MSILTRYIFKEMVGPTFLGFCFYTAIILMQRLFDLAGLIIRGSLSASAVGKLLFFSLPNIIVLTLPMSLLFGILIAVGRLSADSEIVAMRALGISTRTIYRPVFMFSVAMFFLNFYLINYVMPQGNRQFVTLRAELMTSSAEKAVKPRVFHDQFDNLMIYVNDVDPASGRWRGVFVADTRADEADPATPQEMADGLTAPTEDQQQLGSLATQGAGQRITVAREGTLSVVRPSQDIWMNLSDAETHVWDPTKPDRYDHTSNRSQRILLPSSGTGATGEALSRSFREMNLRELIDQERALKDSHHESDRMNRNFALVEIHKKFAFPFACIAFGILGLPLGMTNRRGGKSSGFSLSIGIILFYYVVIMNGEQLAGAGRIPPFVGMWAANIILFGAGIYLLSRANRDFVQSSEGGALSRISRRVGRFIARRGSRDATSTVANEQSLVSRLDVAFPNIVDRYILREFLKILLLVLVSVIALFTIVDYTEIAKDIRENQVPLSILFSYYPFQIMNILNWTLPISVLVATLVTFGILGRNNEITAIKANGVSLYRVALPILAVATIISGLSYLLLDFVLPHANDRASEAKRTIEGKPPLRAGGQQKLWLLGKGRYIINFLAYDRNARQLSQVQVFELHPTEFRLTRRVYARTAAWTGDGWAFRDGWMRSFRDDGSSTFTQIKTPLTLFYKETPEDFATEVKPPEQMTYAQLRRYVDALDASGYASEELAVKLYTKTSWPVISIVMALIAMPFAFRMGKRGALYGIGIALVLGIVYWLIFAVFTKFGEVGNLPPLLAAWSANVLFALAAVYLFVHVET